MAIIKGNNFANSLVGTAAADTIYGLGGNDTLRGGNGADRLDGGVGIDTIVYGDSAAGVGVNLATGYGYGGTAEGDTLVSIENILGSGHNDSLFGNGFANFLNGESGNDILKGAGGDDRLVGGFGDDALKGGGGADQLIGGFGIDTVDYSQSLEAVRVTLFALEGEGGDAEGDSYDGIENVTGSPYGDIVFGDGGANVIRGLDGNDTLLGQNGDDIVDGGAGADVLDGFTGFDTLIGGLGDDSYSIFFDAIDTVVERGGEGFDTVHTGVSYALTPGADIELFEAGGDATEAIDLTGNASGNIIRGHDGNNIIAGGDGNDQLTGFAGQDSFRFDTPLNAAFNVDFVTDFNVADDTILLDRDIFSSSLGLGNISASEFVIGTAALDANDRIIYNSSTGALLYDSDGNGSTAAIRFASVSTGLALTNLDFLVVA